ncbi:aminotransferase class IV [Nocardioides sp. CER19]|uniref:aminotransferase class IV n=1 Tax=Nocardioides sp. CER19 TaxID=3038538 RepID=UPI00244B90B1|nr:aminotransferase class IV [Nocardioides sp. CER19]MDH2416135.1 aminotransferase class IV [Nocardioides sp. CER19]
MALTTEDGSLAYKADTGIDYITYSDYTLSADNPLAGAAAWIEGEFVPADQARISIFDQGYLHSDVTYTVFHVWHGRAFRLTDHIDRLFQGAEAMRIDPPMTKDEVARIALELVARTELREAYVSISLTRGYATSPGERDMTKHRPQIYMYAVPYQWIVPFERIANGVKAMVAQTVRRAGRNVIDPHVKNYQWGDLIRAIHENRDRGYEMPILLDVDGLVAEGPGFNVAIIKDGELLTPGGAALPGITRKSVLEVAEALGLRTRLADITLDDLYNADEALGCTTAGGVWPFVSFDDAVLGDGTPGPYTRRIIEGYWGLINHPELITPVRY